MRRARISLRPAMRIKSPRSILADEGDRKRKIIRSDHHYRLVVAFHRDPVLCIIGSDKFMPGGSVGDLVTGRYDVFTIGAQDRHDGFRVTRFGCAGERAGSLVGCLECLLASRLPQPRTGAPLIAKRLEFCSWHPRS